MVRFGTSRIHISNVVYKKRTDGGAHVSGRPIIIPGAYSKVHDMPSSDAQGHLPMLTLPSHSYELPDA